MRSAGAMRDGRDFQDVGAEFGKLPRKLAGLFARARDDDAPAEKRTCSRTSSSFLRNLTTSPMTVSARRLEIRFLRATSAMVASVPSMVCWRPVVPQRIMATGVFPATCRSAMRVCGNRGCADAHENDFGAGDFGHLRPIHIRPFLCPGLRGR